MSYERRDLPARGVIMFGGALAAAVTLVLLASGALLDVLVERRPAPAPGPLAPPPRVDAPRLEPDPLAALAALRRAEAERLGSYGWVDRERGVARIPIERAMELFLRRGPR
jgi:hypothetical protein